MIDHILPPDHPLQAAWAQYRRTHEFASLVRLLAATRAPHSVDGALYAAFFAGWMTQAGVRPETISVHTRAPSESPLEHKASADCWCEPKKIYTDPATGASVFVHAEPH